MFPHAPWLILVGWLKLNKAPYYISVQRLLCFSFSSRGKVISQNGKASAFSQSVAPHKATARNDRIPPQNGESVQTDMVEQSMDVLPMQNKVRKPSANGHSSTEESSPGKVRKIQSFKMTKVYADGEFV